jgi:hypothetical protein
MWTATRERFIFKVWQLFVDGVAGGGIILGREDIDEGIR